MNLRYLGIFLIISLSIITLSSAQLGEQSGQPTMYVNVSSSSTFSYYVLNGGSSPISFRVVPPSLNSIPNNETPIVTITPMNGTIMPDSERLITINVSVPSSDKPGLKWYGVVQVVEANPINVTASGEGAVITAGVAKLLTIYSTVPKPTQPYYIIIVIVVIIAAALVLLYRYRVRAGRAARGKVGQTAASVRSERERVNGNSVKRESPRRARRGRSTARGVRGSRGGTPNKRRATRSGSARSRGRSRLRRSRGR